MYFTAVHMVFESHLRKMKVTHQPPLVIADEHIPVAEYE